MHCEFRGARREVASLLVAAALGFPSHAQEALPAIDVPAEGVERFEAKTVAKKTEEKAIETMGGGSTLVRRDIERYQPSTIADLLRNVPGVATQENHNDPGQSINIRGLQDFGRVNVLVDGARQNYQISGHNANGTFYLEPEFLAQADVVRGPISNIYGSGAIGGVVSFRTRGADDILAPDEKYGVVQKVGVGSNGQNSLDSTAMGARVGAFADVFGQFVYRNRSSYNDGAGQRVPDTGSELMGGLAKLNVRPDDGHKISASALVQNYSFTNSGFDNAGTRFQNDVDARTFTLGYRFERPDVPLLDLNAKAYYTETSNDQTVLLPTSTFSALGAFPGGKRRDHIGTWGVDINNTSRFSTFVVDHALTIGGDVALDRVDTSDLAGGFLTALTPSGERRLAGAFVQDEARFGPWLRALSALRFDEYALSGGAFSSGGSRLSPRITIGVSPIPGVELYATYAEGYRAPSITETLVSGTHPFPAFNILPNPLLKPEIARDLEGGVNLKYDDILIGGDKLRAKLGVFQNRVENFIEIQSVGAPHLVPFIPGRPASLCMTRPFLCFPIQDSRYVNVARAEISGFEGEGAYDWGGGFVSAAGFINSGTNKTTNAPLNSVAPGRLVLTLGLRPLGDALTIGGRYTVVDRSPTAVANPSKSYDYVDVFANYVYDDRISANVFLSNVFDRKYTQYLYTAPSPGFTVKFSMAVKFASK